MTDAGVARIAEDARTYRSARARYPFAKRTPEETGADMHDHIIKRGLRVIAGPVNYYSAEHVFSHPTPENKAAVGRAYFGLMANRPGAVKLARRGVIRLARLNLEAGQPYHGYDPDEGEVFNHPITDETGQQVGHVKIAPKNDGNHLHVKWIGTGDGSGLAEPNALGTEAMRSVLSQLPQHYPDAEFVSGRRISGFRSKPGQRVGERVVIPIKRLKLAGRRKALTPADAAPQEEATTPESEHDKLLKATRRASYQHEYTPMLALADKLDEDGRLGGNILRMSHAAKTLHGESATPQLAFAHMTRGVTSPDGKLEIDSEVGSDDPSGEKYHPILQVTHHLDKDDKHGFGGFIHHIPVRSLKHFRELLRELPSEMQRQLVTHHLESRRPYGIILPATHPADGTEDTSPVKKLARTRMNDEGSANAMAGSMSGQTRLSIARQILQEAGLTPSTVRAAISHNGGDNAASVVQMIRRPADPEHVRYAAAWRGLLLNEPGVSVFHPEDKGDDLLHVINTPHEPYYLAERLRSAGVPKFTTEKTATGSRAYVVNPRGAQGIERVAESIPDASHSAIRGRSYRLGVSSGADAAGGVAGSTASKSSTPASRANYRSVIDEFESAATGR